MNLATANEHSAYTTNQRNEETVRETEARALLNCANRLEAARHPDCSADDFREAIYYNQKLWTIFQSCLVDKENPLPRDLKTTLLNLSVFVDKTSFTALSERKPEVLQGLIDINRRLAAGLSVKQDEPKASPSSPSSEVTSVTTSA